MTVIFGRNITNGDMCFQTRLFPCPHNANGWFPFCHASLSPTEDAQICKLVIIALVIYVIVVREHVCIGFCCFSCVMPALFVSVASYHIVVKELIDGTKIWLYNSEVIILILDLVKPEYHFLDYWTQHCSCRYPGDHVAQGISCCNVGVDIRVRVTKFL